MKQVVLMLAAAVAMYGQTANADLTKADQSRFSRQSAAKLKRATDRMRKNALAAMSSAPVPVFGNVLTMTTKDSVEWTLAPSDCAVVKSTLMAKGTIKMVLTVQANADGTFNFEEVDEASGLATDAAGKHFIFEYRLVQNIDSNTGLPQPVPPFDFYGPDSFKLIPVDGGTGFSVDIYFVAGLDAMGNYIDRGLQATQDLNCDPI